jgi:hypothetical protein
VPKKAKKRVKRRQLEMESYVFSIKEWKHDYSWSINLDKYRQSPYREHLAIDLDAECVFPQALTGRTVRFALMAERSALRPAVFENDPEWIPRCVGYLEMKPSGGHFYMSFPHDSFVPVLNSLSQGRFRYIDVYGPKRSRSGSYCSSFRLMSSFDPEDY